MLKKLQNSNMIFQPETGVKYNWYETWVKSMHFMQYKCSLHPQKAHACWTISITSIIRRAWWTAICQYPDVSYHLPCRNYFPTSDDKVKKTQKWGNVFPSWTIPEGNSPERSCTSIIAKVRILFTVDIFNCKTSQWSLSLILDCTAQ